MKQFRSRSAFFFFLFLFYHILGVKLVLTHITLYDICKMYNYTISECCMKFFTKIFLYYQQGSKSLKSAINTGHKL